MRMYHETDHLLIEGGKTKKNILGTPRSCDLLVAFAKANADLIGDQGGRRFVVFIGASPN